jgi:hypothetical protein
MAVEPNRNLIAQRSERILSHIDAPKQQIAHSLPAVEGKRRSLEVGIEGAALHHVLTDPNHCLVVEQRQRSGAWQARADRLGKVTNWQSETISLQAHYQ